MEALGENTDSSENSAVIKGGSEEDFLTRELLLAIFIQTVAWTLWKKLGKHIQSCIFLNKMIGSKYGLIWEI